MVDARTRARRRCPRVFCDQKWFALVKDSFSDGNSPPSAPNFVDGTPASYSVKGAIPSNSEGNGRLRLDSINAAPTQSATNQPRLSVHATLLSDTSNAPASLGAGSRATTPYQCRAYLVLPLRRGRVHRHTEFKSVISRDQESHRIDLYRCQSISASSVARLLSDSHYSISSSK